MNWEIFSLFALSYLLGSIPFGKVISHHYGIDIQKRGSGNIGFANAYRTLRKGPALLVLILDVLKGYIPVFLALHVGATHSQTFLIGIVAVVGHVFPIWLRFRGGKGVATSLGVLVGIEPVLGVVGFLLWLLIICTTKVFSIASLGAVWGITILSGFLFTGRIMSLYIGALALGITLLHTENLKRLYQGTENQL